MGQGVSAMTGEARGLCGLWPDPGASQKPSWTGSSPARPQASSAYRCGHLCESVASVINYHKPGGLTQIYSLPGPGARVMVWAGLVPSGGSRVQSISWPSSASRGHLHHWLVAPSSSHLSLLLLSPGLFSGPSCLSCKDPSDYIWPAEVMQNNLPLRGPQH